MPRDGEGTRVRRPGTLFSRLPRLMLSESMKPPDVYSDWRIVGGIALIILGAANWTIGLRRTEQYDRMIAQAANLGHVEESYRSFDELDPHTDAAVLEPLTAEQRKVSYAAARMDFYHATFLTGQVLVVAGLTLAALGFVAVIRRDTLIAMRGLEAGTSAPAPRR
jgi:hypothetical protein